MSDECLNYGKSDLMYIIKSQNEIIEMQKKDLRSLKNEIILLNKQIDLLRNKEK